MAQEIEIEFKNLLTKAEYDLLLEHLPFPESGQEQINYYFETPDRKLQMNGSALRIREKNGSHQLTLKQPHEVGLLETHDTLSHKEAMEWINHHPIVKEATTKQLKQLNISVTDLKCYGSLTTIRREFRDKGLIYVLDHSIYHNQEDYELELEAPNFQDGITAFEALLQNFNITKKETPNKIARFFNSLT
ncbi:CYTH domain-containing protein [Ornithinibacillus contaminans]|uniref:CYTH domain-containing protein n=1 Tax=Ornithinibacillus contaminans TaxID=694055 RepID=UPI00064E14EE|nr:CYTH domain-containing protein [Ornithinibacillus contaminans]